LFFEQLVPTYFLVPGDECDRDKAKYRCTAELLGCASSTQQEGMQESGNSRRNHAKLPGRKQSNVKSKTPIMDERLKAHFPVKVEKLF
jgi:hypothetical protein